MNLLHSVKDVKRLIEHYGLSPDYLDCGMIFANKEEYSCLFIDAITHRVVAFIEKGKTDICFTGEFKRHLAAIPSYSPSEAKALERKERKEKGPIEIDVRLDLDSILDKIGKKGVSSLTINEKSFLEEYSKK